MKHFPYSIILLALPASASVVFNFETQSEGDFFAGGGVTGWTQDSPNPPGFLGAPDSPLAYIQESSDFSGTINLTGHLGTQRANTPDGSPTTLTGDLTASGLFSNPGLVSLNIGIEDDPNDSFTTRDSFQVGVTNTLGTSLGVIGISPNAGDNTLWDIAVGATASSLNPTSFTMTRGLGYYFEIDFSSTSTEFFYGGSVSFDGSVLPGLLLTSLGSIAPASPGVFGEIAMTHIPNSSEPIGSSASTLVFDNITVIPEPSLSLLLFSLVPGFLLRRKR